MIIRICKSCGEITEFENIVQDVKKYVKGGYCKDCCMEMTILEALEKVHESEEI